jgi:uncharacterized protein YndB with AHSA1/START domain
VTAPTTKPEAEPFVIARVFNAPRELVFKAFTDPEMMKHWWGPKGFKVVAQTMDLRPGGMYHYGLVAADGNAIWGRMIYREIAAPERVVFVNSFSDEKAGLTRHPMSAGWPLEILSTIVFEDLGDGRTRMTITSLPINETDAERETFNKGRASMTGGWTGTLDQLAAYLAQVRGQRVAKG